MQPVRLGFALVVFGLALFGLVQGVHSLALPDRTASFSRPASVVQASDAPANELFSAPVPPAVVSTVAPSSGECRSIQEGPVGDAPTFGLAGSAFVYTEYFLSGQPERDIVLPGGIWSLPPAVSGHWWAYTGSCSPDWMEHEASLARQRRIAVGANIEPGGDASLFSHVSS